MGEKKPFSDKRWNDDTIPKVVGHVTLTKEEREAAEKRMDGYVKLHEEARKKYLEEQAKKE